jgi:SAM-dependent methyltransferase
MPYHVDGMIYTPGTEPYPSTGRTWPQLFKWKPPELNTIDFLIEIVKGENGKDRLYPYIKLETVGEKAKDTSPYKVTQYKILKLKVGGMKEKFNRRTNRVQRKWGPIPFAEYPEAKIPVDDLGRIIARDPLHKIVTEVLDDTIVEFSYHAEREFPWVPIRVRHEKTTLYRSTYSTFGNVAATASSVWKSIQVPVTREMITSGVIPPPSDEDRTRYVREQSEISQKRLPYQTFHTVFVKDKLLRQAALDPKDPDRGAGYLIDFGSSRGGDFNRWANIGYTRVVGIDLDANSVRQARTRYEGNRNRERVNVSYLCGDLSKSIFPNYVAACPISESQAEPINWKDVMKANLPRQYMFDVVSSQFVIHYMFTGELALRSYLQNVTDNLKIGGKFTGSTFDGQRVYNSLKRKKKISGSKKKNTIWEITKDYGSKKFVDGRPNWGMKINVFIATIGIAHPEYLVSFKYLENIAKEYGLKLDKITPFADYYKEAVESDSNVAGVVRAMTEEEKTFSFLFSSFEFTKERNAPDSTYKKLVKLQRKAAKKK